MTEAQSTIDIARAIDERPMGALQIGVIALCAVIAFLDGLDTQSIAIAAPLLAETMGLSRAALGPALSAGLLGAMIGALTFGPLGDRFGRKRLLVVAAVTFGVFTLLTAYPAGYYGLLAIRFLAGIGLGGATPCFIALASEYAPTRRRAMVTSLAWAAFPIGGSLGALMNAFLASHYGWQSIFVVGGVLALIAAIALVAWLPESIRYLLANGGDRATIGRIASRMLPEIPAGAAFQVHDERIASTPVRQLFSEGRGPGTLLLWVPFMTAFGTLAISALWTPTLMREYGYQLSQIGVVVSLSGIGAIVGMASAGRLMEAVGPKVVLIPSLLFGALSMAALGFATGSVALLTTVLVSVALFVGIGASGSLALASLVYPTAIRSTGVGWAIGMGRFGQVITPLVMGLIVARQWSTASIFLTFAIAPAAGALAVLFLRWDSAKSETAAPR